MTSSAGGERQPPPLEPLGIGHLAGPPNVELESRDAMLDAVDLHHRGLDLADALHLTRSRHCEGLASFDDRRFVRRARRLGGASEVAVY